MAVSDGRPSRRKNPPGIFPAAYMRSSTSTVSGKKSMPSRGLELVQVARICVSPIVTTAEPAACLASLPDSIRMSEDPTVLDAWFNISFPPCDLSRGAGQFSVEDLRGASPETHY